MERLTKHNIYFDGQHGYEALGYSMTEQRPFYEIIKRLSEYEDIGLTPEEIRELQQDYHDGEYEYCGEYGTDSCQFQHKLEKLQADRDYWKAEALKHCAKLGEIKLLVGRTNE